MRLSAKDLKVGDWVRRPCWKVNGPFYEVAEIKIERVWVKVPVSGNLVSYDNIHDWEKKSTPFPLYSEEQAVAFLTEKGYKVEEPPKPQTGKMRIVQNREGVIFGSPLDGYTALTSKVLAIVDWTEGQGLSPKSS